MSEPQVDKTAAYQLPEAVLEQRSRFSLVWLIPLVALAIGSWLAYKAYSEQGPTITITFETATGLEAGKTKLKYKDVEFGLVEHIALSEDLSHTIITASLIKGAEIYLTDKTRFWVERARISAGQVSGISTLFAGVYIAIDPVTEGQRTRTFTGLEAPPVVMTGQLGRRFTLGADGLGSLDIGSPVYFRSIKVGQVMGYQLDENGQRVSISIFINAPHDQLVNTNTRFWNVSGLDFTLDASGVKVDTASVVSLMIGGVAFETPVNLEAGRAVDEGSVFMLHPNRQSIQEGQYVNKSYWLLHFAGSVRGLAVGAPVEFRGMRIGQVTDIKLEFDFDKVVGRIPVLIAIEADRIQWVGNHLNDGGNSQNTEKRQRRFWNQLIAKGMRAQLKTGSFLTGALFVDLDFYPDAPAQRIVWQDPYPELPTVPTPLEELESALTDILAKIQRLPLEKMGANLQQSLTALKQTAVESAKLTRNLNTHALPEVTATFKQIQRTLATAEKALAATEKTIASAERTMVAAEKTIVTTGKSVAKDSPLQQEVRRMLKELSAAARSLRMLTDYLERHPESLLKGKTR